MDDDVYFSLSLTLFVCVRERWKLDFQHIVITDNRPQTKSLVEREK